MDIEKLMELRQSNEAPFNHEEYTVWLHNKILEDIRNELWEHREGNQGDAKNYVLCNKVFNFKSLQPIH